MKDIKISFKELDYPAKISIESDKVKIKVNKALSKQDRQSIIVHLLRVHSTFKKHEVQFKVHRFNAVCCTLEFVNEKDVKKFNYLSSIFTL